MRSIRAIDDVEAGHQIEALIEVRLGQIHTPTVVTPALQASRHHARGLARHDLLREGRQSRRDVSAAGTHIEEPRLPLGAEQARPLFGAQQEQRIGAEQGVHVEVREQGAQRTVQERHGSTVPTATRGVGKGAGFVVDLELKEALSEPWRQLRDVAGVRKGGVCGAHA